MKTKIRQLPVIPTNPLPPLYAAWMDEALSGGHIPSETDATCNNCAMLPDDKEQTDSNQYFNPQTKCCTYLPELHNFLAGRILSDENPAFTKGRATVEARLKASIGVTPLGIGSTSLYSLLYNNSSDLFGRAGSMRCPHYIEEEDGQCGVWKNREAVCATWFCKHTRGMTGKNFWMRILQLLLFIEKNVSLWCVTKLDIGTDALQTLLPLFKSTNNAKPTAKEIDGKHDEKLYRVKWGSWFGREAEFYKECALLVSDLKWSDIKNICGPELQIHIQLLQEAHQKLVSEELPQRLKVGSFRLSGMEQGAFAVGTYSNYDTMRLPQSVIGILAYFDGRPVEDVLDEIMEKEKLRVSLSLVRKLVDFGLLVTA